MKKEIKLYSCYLDGLSVHQDKGHSAKILREYKDLKQKYTNQNISTK